MTRIWLGDVVEGHRWLSIGSAAAEAMEREHRTRVLAVSAQLAVFAIDAFDGSVARRAVEASEGRPGIWSSLAHSLLCLNTGIHAFVTKDQALVAETDRLGRRAIDLAEGPLSQGLAWFWVGQARVLVDDLDGAIDALERGSIEVVPGGDVSVISLAQLSMVLHVRGRHDEALDAALAVFPRSQAFLDSGLWVWVVYCSLPYALELGHLERHAEALAFVRDLLDDSDAMSTPGVVTSVVIVLGALAQMRGDLARADLLLRCAGEAIIRTGARSTVDVVLHTYYFEKVGPALDGAEAVRNTERAAEMGLAAAVRLGLDG